MRYRFGEFELDTEKFELKRKGTAQHIEPLVFDLLCFLVCNPNRVLSRSEIVDAVWNGRIVSEATISSCIKSVRKALGDSGDSQRYIRTVRGRGFQFTGDAAEDNGAVADRTGASRPGAADDAITPKARTDMPVLAVLPFNNLSADVDEYFADGLTEDIITNLSRFRDLLVIARTTTFRFKGQTPNLAELGAELAAGYVVKGGVRRAAGRVRVSAQLIDAATGVHIWADHYDRDMEDIFAVQDEVTRTIAAALGVKVQDAALQQAMKKSPAELDAYDRVLRARRYTSSLSAESHAEARDLLETAILEAPNYAEAHALLANVYLAEHRFGANPRPDAIERALKMAERATELDPQNAYARCWLAIVHFFRRENDKFQAEADRALALNPNDPETLADIGHYLAFMGEFKRGMELNRRARQLNPLHPGWYHFCAVRVHYNSRAYDEALKELARISMPHFYWLHMLTAAARAQLGQADASGSLRKVYELKPDFSAHVELNKWNAAPDDFAHILEGLRKAGLDE